MNWKKAAVVVTGNVYLLGSLALIGWGIFRFFKGIRITQDVPNVDSSFHVPLSPYSVGLIDHARYFFMAADSFGSLFLPASGLLWVIIWPVFLGGFLLFWGWPIVKDQLLRIGGLTSAAGREHPSQN